MLKYISKYKKYRPLDGGRFYDEKKEGSHKYVSNIWNYDDFLASQVHIIKSTTGTGKTTATSKHMKRYMKGNKMIIYWVFLVEVACAISMHSVLEILRLYLIKMQILKEPCLLLFV